MKLVQEEHQVVQLFNLITAIWRALYWLYNLKTNHNFISQIIKNTKFLDQNTGSTRSTVDFTLQCNLGFGGGLSHKKALKAYIGLVICINYKISECTIGAFIIYKTASHQKRKRGDISTQGGEEKKAKEQIK